MTSLKSLLKHHGSDKTDEHSYGDFYESWLLLRRELPLKILEIGIFRGASLLAFRDYLPFAEIHGVDINHKAMILGQERITTHVCNQADKRSIQCICQEHGPFDLVIDDGSHLPQDQMKTFYDIAQFVQDGGMYVIEDVASPQDLLSIPGSKVVDLRWKKNRHDDILVVIEKEAWERHPVVHPSDYF